MKSKRYVKAHVKSDMMVNEHVNWFLNKSNQSRYTNQIHLPW